KRWIEEIRPKDLPHSYLLWTQRGPRKNQLVQPRAFQRWCNKAEIHPHVLRYSFATHYYNESKDVKLISELLGHSNVSTTSEYLQLGQKETMTKARKLFDQA
ncbi:MAG: tyrosine-type recombinase/integrase, partial [Candidatus Hodarchaeales archaeon]